MQQMEEPQHRSYSEGYHLEGNEQPHSANNYLEQQHKLQPAMVKKLLVAQTVFGVFSIVISSLVMGLAIAFLTLMITLFNHLAVPPGLPENVSGVVVAGFVLALILFPISIAGFVISIVQFAFLRRQRQRIS